jgi:thioredoxin reductase
MDGVMMSNKTSCEVTIIGAGPYGLSAAAYLGDSGIETRVFGEPMSFWERQMPKGMCLRSNWDASHIADPRRRFTLDEYLQQNGNHFSKPIPLSRFVEYGKWYQRRAVPHVDRRMIQKVEPDGAAFKVTVSDGESFTSTRVVVAAGINSFAYRPAEFDGIPSALASHSSHHSDLNDFKGQRIVVIGAGQSALESGVLCREAGADVEVIARQDALNWVGLHPRLHHLGAISKLLYSPRDVGPAGISRLVAAPHLFRRLPRWIQDPMSYRSIRPAVAGWLRPRLEKVPITFGRKVTEAAALGSQIQLRLDDGTERIVDHVLLATGFRVDVSRFPFLSPQVLKRLRIARGYPVLGCGLESSIPGLHFVGKPGAWSFGPIVGFVSGTEFVSPELTQFISRRYARPQSSK